MFPFIIKPNIGDNIGLSMKFLLTLIMCSYTEATCMPPFTHPEKFRDAYDCLLKGYDEADKKIREIGREDINKHQIYIRFTCTQIDSV